MFTPTVWCQQFRRAYGSNLFLAHFCWTRCSGSPSFLISSKNSSWRRVTSITR